MRIGMMADAYKPHVSGITNVISLSKRFLEKAGHEVYVFTFGGGDYQDDEPNVVRTRGMPLVDTGRAATLMGAAGCGQLTKMVNQVCIAGVLQGLAEGFNFAVKAGLDGDKVVDVISKGAAGSWQMENRARTMVKDEFDFGFAVNWMRKDLNITLEEAGRNGARLPMTALVDQFYAQVQARGGGRWDTSSLIQLLAHD